MDKQRATRTGLANAFFVAKLRDETVAELIQVQNELRKQYIGVEGCLSRPESFHVTLVGAHVSCNEDMEILMKALDSFSNDEQENSSEPTLLRGLGSWKTAGGSYCLFGEVLHAQHIASLAVSLSRHLMAVCNAREDGCFGSSFSWVDVVTEELYQPHVTIAMIDPRIDGKVWESGCNGFF